MLAVRWIFELARGEGDWKAEMPVDKRARETERNFMVQWLAVSVALDSQGKNESSLVHRPPPRDAYYSDD